MTPLGWAFFLFNGLLLLFLKRHWAILPFLLCACYITSSQTIEIGPFNFTVIRLLIAVGVFRVVFRNERPVGGLNTLDLLMLLWAAWILLALWFHNDPGSVYQYRLGVIYNVCGIYFLFRTFCRTTDDVRRAIVISAVLLVPVSAAMLNEVLSGYNLFSYLGGVPEIPDVRGERFRAQGPFSHAILAGTVGAVCAPLFVGIWRAYPKIAMAGLAASVGMMFSSGSSGPILSCLAGILALMMWPWRHGMRLVRWGLFFGYIGLDIVMKAPAYYLIARIDLGLGSTGWHRARLIESAIEHFSEWWFIGTDYTRHWMATGVPWSEDHTDITNHYLAMGVLSGLPLMLLFLGCLAVSFVYLGQIIAKDQSLTIDERYLFWAIGASLFSHATTMISVSYFDQSYIFLYLAMAVIGSSKKPILDDQPVIR